MTFFIPSGDELLSCKELAAALKRTPTYVSAMRRDGFPMPGSRATVNQALLWLHLHPDFQAEPSGSERGKLWLSLVTNTILLTPPKWVHAKPINLSPCRKN